MSGAWPPPAPSVWKVDGALADGGEGVPPQNRIHSGCRCAGRPGRPFHRRRLTHSRSPPGWRPSPHGSFRPITPAATFAGHPAGENAALAQAGRYRVVLRSPAACVRYTTARGRWWHGARGRAGVAADRGSRRRPAPFPPVADRSSNRGNDPAGGDNFPSAAITSVAAPMGMVTLGWMSGLLAVADGEDPPSFTPISALTIPVTTINALVSTRSTQSAASICPWPMPSRITFAAAEFDLPQVVNRPPPRSTARHRQHPCRRRLGRTYRHRPGVKYYSSFTQRAHNLAAEAEDGAVTGEGHQLDLAFLAGFKA